MLRRLFLDHPHSVGETYLGHMRTAFGLGLRLVAAGCACLVHGVAPALFETTGSRTVKHLHEKMARRGSAALKGDGQRVAAE